MLHGDRVEGDKRMDGEGLKTTSGQKNPHEDDSMVPPALGKDAILIDDQKEAID